MFNINKVLKINVIDDAGATAFALLPRQIKINEIYLTYLNTYLIIVVHCYLCIECQYYSS